MPPIRPFLKQARKIIVNLDKPLPKRPFVVDAEKIAPTGGDVPHFFSSEPKKRRLDFVLNSLPEVAPGRMRLFRVEAGPIGPEITRRLPGMSQPKPELERVRGQWFTSNPLAVRWFLTKRPDSKLLWIDVPKKKVRRFSSAYHPIAGPHSEGRGEFILPRKLVSMANEVSFDIAYWEPTPHRRIGPPDERHPIRPNVWRQ